MRASIVVPVLLALAGTRSLAQDDTAARLPRVFRFQTGVTGLSGGHYCKERSTAITGFCNDPGRFSFWPLLVRGELDVPLGRVVSMAGGLAVSSGIYYDRSATFVEPTVDVRTNAELGRIGTRAYVGVGVPISTQGYPGIEGRAGLGGSLWFARSWGLGLDMVLSVGGYRGFEVGSFSFTLGPQLRI